MYIYIYICLYLYLCLSQPHRTGGGGGGGAAAGEPGEGHLGPLCPLSAIFGTCFPRCKEEPVLYAGARSTDPTSCDCERGVFAAQCVFQEWRWAEVTDAVVQIAGADLLF